MRSAIGLISLALLGCNAPATCEDHFVPYPDMISGRARTAKNGVLLDGMRAYAEGDHATASELLSTYLSGYAPEQQIRLYLANSLIALGKPFDAELQLDFLERDGGKVFKDQIEWYRALCFLCSDQRDRALQAATLIASSPQQAYKEEAALLAADLRSE
ncbi:MAG: hypothetical protein IPG74_13040 [Flavobacteriales bacterium]|nr:hypothetical protein [Flavobacteriales bacterium]